MEQRFYIYSLVASFHFLFFNESAPQSNTMSIPHLDLNTKFINRHNKHEEQQQIIKR